MDFEPGEAKPGRAGLPGAEHVTLAAQLEVLLGDTEAVLGLAQVSSRTRAASLSGPL